MQANQTSRVRVALPNIYLEGDGAFTDASAWIGDPSFNYKGNFVGYSGFGFGNKREKFGTDDFRVSEFAPRRLQLTADAADAARGKMFVRVNVDGLRRYFQMPDGGDGVARLLWRDEMDAIAKAQGQDDA